MRKLILCLLLCAIVQVAEAQRVSRNYKDKTMSKVLVDLRHATNRYKISFIHNELEDYTVTKNFNGLTIPEAIRECIGFYPITMKVEGDSLIFVEAVIKTGSKLIGRLIDSKKHPVIYANIALLNVSDSAIVSSGVSNENGDFVIPTTEKQVRVRISCIGYETLILNCETGNLGTITMQETTKHISEVVVEGNLMHSQLDKDVYMPNQRQRNAASDGLGLLSNLGIPQLDVNPITQSISSNNGKSVSLYIDGRKVNQDELSQIRPKDILRIEFLETPTGKYANDEQVVNFITRQYNYGGYVALKSNTKFINVGGNNSVQVNLDNKKMHYVILAGMNYSNQRSLESQKEEDITTGTTSFHKSSSISSDHVKNGTYYGLLRTRYQTDKLNLTARAKINWSKQPVYNNYQDITYTGEVNEKTQAIRSRDSRNIDPSITLNADYAISKKQNLTVYADLQFGHHRYNSCLTENGYLVNNYTKENSLTSMSYAIYTNQLGEHDDICIQVLDLYSRYDDYYTGTTVSDQKLRANELLVFPIYNHRFNKKLYLSLRPFGFSLAHWRIQDYQQNHFSSRAAVTARFVPHQQHNLSASFYLGNNFPDPDITSNVDQEMNRYETQRGNPELEKAIFETQLFTYNFNAKNYHLSMTAEHEGIHNIPKEWFYTEGDHLIHSYISEGNVHKMSLNVTQTFFLMKRNLQLQGTVETVRHLVTGYLGDASNCLIGNINVRYYAGPWTFYAFFKSGTKAYLADYGPAFFRQPADYGLSITYGKRNLNCQLGVRKPFAHSQFHEMWRNADLYSFNQRSVQASLKPWLYVNLAYTFDFGRKTKHEDVHVDQTSKSAILGK